MKQEGEWGMGNRESESEVKGSESEITNSPCSLSPVPYSHNEDALCELVWTLETGRGEFRLVLARCNYLRLRARNLKSLQQATDIDLQIINLKKTDKTLYARIYGEIENKQPAALMVLGLESVDEIEQMLSAANQVREEFRKNFHFPIVLWVTDEIFRKLAHFASDFESWTTTVEFIFPTDELIQSLQQDTDAIFVTALSSDTYSIGWQMGYLRRREIVSALKDLEQRGQQIEPALKASVLFVCGQDAYLKNQIEEALDYYQQSLAFWENCQKSKVKGQKLEDSSCELLSPLLRAGVLQFYIGLCYLQQAERYRGKYRENLKSASLYLQNSINVFTEANAENLVAKFINPLGEVLQRLEAWEELQKLAKKSLNLQRLYGNPIRVAQAYGFFAEVAFSRGNWGEAKHYAHKALHNIAKLPSKQQQHRSLYLLLLAEAEQKLGQMQRAVKHLRQAQDIDSQENPRQYIRILQALQKLFWEQKKYDEAFRIKQERRSIEQQYGFRAFIGALSIQPQKRAKLPLTQTIDTPDTIFLAETIAPEIAASGRERDVECLLDRIARPDYKLIVIHGYSGVGKSSLVQAGLIPALRNRSIGTQYFLPIDIKVYTNWVEELGRRIAESEKERENEKQEKCLSHSQIIEKLRKIENSQLRPVLIFDQFEEFIFVYKSATKRREFFQFLGDCLNILGVKVILSLRQDYLHYLLECNKLTNMSIINNDILSKNILYQIGNFQAADAKSLVKQLTARSDFHLEDSLIEQLVEDLSVKYSEVRPIELQVAGAQLQTENITTLAGYQERGPQQELVKRYLKEVVEDCGGENKQIAEIVLYLLTDEKGTRPMKTRADIERDLQVLATDFQPNTKQLDLVLYIFVESGIVFLIPDNPEHCYQLVHDYIAAFIQKQHKPKFNELITELIKERQQRKLSEDKLNKFYKWGLYGAIFAILAILAIIIALSSLI